MKNLISQALSSSSRFNSIVQLDCQSAWCVLTAFSSMKRLGKIQGAEQHRRLNRLLSENAARSESDLRSWMLAAFPGLSASLWDTCRKQASGFLEAGVSVFTWVSGVTGAHPSLGNERGWGDLEAPKKSEASFAPLTVPYSPCSGKACPTVLFGKGGLVLDLPLLAVFNSRKPRLVSPDSRWLEALRFFFRTLDSREIAVAGSTGTLTYDLAAELASRSGLPQLQVAPYPLQAVPPSGIPALSCMLDSATCPKEKAPICRDRILATLANLHLVLEIRDRGNLLAILEEIQAKSPRQQFIFDSGTPSSTSAGSYALLEKFPEHACTFKLPRCQEPTAGASIQNDNRLRVKDSALLHVRSTAALCASGNYLFHYTRACAGPWPGQAYRQYLLDLLDGDPLSGHSALDVLIRILQEGTIRAGARIVRGREAVICWSSHPPHELFLMRKWNRALVRWTVEPYGIAVRRDILRSLGAKPAVYGTERTWSRLGEPERYRFQLSRSTPSASWRHEREWRLPGDLALDKIRLSVKNSVLGSREQVPGRKTAFLPASRFSLPASEFSPQGFVFVQTKEEKARLFSHVNPGLSIVVLV